MEVGNQSLTDSNGKLRESVQQDIADCVFQKFSSKAAATSVATAQPTQIPGQSITDSSGKLLKSAEKAIAASVFRRWNAETVAKGQSGHPFPSESRIRRTPSLSTASSAKTAVFRGADTSADTTQCLIARKTDGPSKTPGYPKEISLRSSSCPPWLRMVKGGNGSDM